VYRKEVERAVAVVSTGGSVMFPRYDWVSWHVEGRDMYSGGVYLVEVVGCVAVRAEILARHLCNAVARLQIAVVTADAAP
jgi:hypothetical protein